jgi:hypothetical protein
MAFVRRLIDRALEWLSVEMERRAHARLAARLELQRPQRQSAIEAYVARRRARPL